MKKHAWLLLLSAPFFLGSCRHFLGKRIRGNGNIRTEERSVGSFRNLEVSSIVNVYVTQGEMKPIRITGDENLLPYIEVEQEGDQVIIRSRPGINLDPSHELNIYVTAPAFSKIGLSGAGNIISEGKITNTENLELDLSGAGDIKMEVDAPKVKADISGVGSIYLKGQTKDVDLQVSGAGSAHCFDLLSENTIVGISGVGSAEVFASVKLDAEVSGAGSVRYKGNASDVNQHVSGVGSVHKE
jgi:hypothetical protein